MSLYIVTGAARGIGAEICRQLLQKDHQVIAIDRIDDINQWELFKLIPEASLNHLDHISCDIRKTNEIIQHIENSILFKGTITGLVNAVGVLEMGSLLNTSVEQWHENLSINFMGPAELSRWVAHQMIPQREGAIVSISSNAALIPRMNMGLYATTKATVSHYFKNLALELAPHNIRCNLVLPGSTLTQMQKQLWTEDRPPAGIVNGNLEQFRNGIPLQKIAEAEDIANAVMFLLSEQAGQITMHELVVDGGATLGV